MNLPTTPIGVPEILILVVVLAVGYVLFRAFRKSTNWRFFVPFPYRVTTGALSYASVPVAGRWT